MSQPKDTYIDDDKDVIDEHHETWSNSPKQALLDYLGLRLETKDVTEIECSCGKKGCRFDNLPRVITKYRMVQK